VKIVRADKLVESLLGVFDKLLNFAIYLEDQLLHLWQFGCVDLFWSEIDLSMCDRSKDELVHPHCGGAVHA
jgi:hypothetical protein